MTVYEVFVKLFAKQERDLAQEVRDRRNIFYQWKPQGVKVNSMPLNYMWQVWHIPAVDGPIEQAVKYTTVRKATARELQLLREKPEGWQKLLLQETGQ